MILIMRRYLLVLLGLLQFVAPLVHAHSDDHSAQFGLHLHSIQVYDNHSHAPILQPVDHLLHLNDAIISISTGIQNQQKSVNNQPPHSYFSPSPFFVFLILISCEINFSPHPLDFAPSCNRSPQSPRAPPIA